MFDLEKNITEWRQRMRAAGMGEPVPLAELENHLREEIEHQMRMGKEAPAAFQMAVQGLGREGELGREFEKTFGPAWHVRRKRVGFIYAATLSFYVVAMAYAMLRNHLSTREWWLGLAAQGALLAGSYFMWHSAARFFPRIESRRAQSAIGLAGGISGTVWLLIFARCILARLSLDPGGLVVAFAWAMVPGMLLPNLAFMLLEQSERPLLKSSGA